MRSLTPLRKFSMLEMRAGVAGPVLGADTGAATAAVAESDKTRPPVGANEVGGLTVAEFLLYSTHLKNLSNQSIQSSFRSLKRNSQSLCDLLRGGAELFASGGEDGSSTGALRERLQAVLVFGGIGSQTDAVDLDSADVEFAGK